LKPKSLSFFEEISGGTRLLSFSTDLQVPL